MRKPNKRLVHCAECGRNKRHVAKGLCQRCYDYQWREDNPERHAASYRKWYEKNGERVRENRRQRYKNNPEHHAEYSHWWYANNRERVAETSRQWREDHREHHAKLARQWKKANPDKRREHDRHRRARKANAIIEPVDEAAVYELCNRTCLYCGATEDLTLDHIVALANGGAHSEDNLVVACRKCNSSKRIKSLEDWLRMQPWSNVWLY